MRDMIYFVFQFRVDESAHNGAVEDVYNVQSSPYGCAIVICNVFDFHSIEAG